MRYKRRAFIILFILAIPAALFWGGWQFLKVYSDYELPKEKIQFENIKPRSALSIVDHEGRVIDYQYGENLLLYKPLGEISKDLVDYVLMAEDAKFYSHKGFDVDEIKNSIENKIEKGKVLRGASTITQQLAKNLFLDKERSWVRKLFEIPWTYRLEKDLKKRQILELYFNVIEWGPGLHGAEAAARHFFDRPASELSHAQAIYLAMIVPNPTRFDVFAHPKVIDFINDKREKFVGRLVNEKVIAPSEQSAYLSEPFNFVPPQEPNRRYPVSHDGDYFGNREDKAKVWQLILSHIPNSKKASPLKRSLSLSLDRNLMNELAAAPLTEDGTATDSSANFLIFKEGAEIRALLPIRGSQRPEMSDTLVEMTSGLEREEVATVDWASLIEK